MKNKTINEIKSKILKILKKNYVIKAGIFGSYARGEEKKNSDVDILVKVKREFGLLDLIRMKIELEKLLRKKVDLVEYETIKPMIKKQILQEEVRIY